MWTFAISRRRIVVGEPSNFARRCGGRPWVVNHHQGVIMNRTSQLVARFAVLAITVVGVVLVTSGRATARICVDPTDAGPVPCPPTSSTGYGSSTTPVQPITDNSDWTQQWMLLAAA